RDWRRLYQVFAFTHWNVNLSSVFVNFQGNIAFELVEKFLAFVVMIILARIRSADVHHDKIVGVVGALISDRRFQQVAMFFDPFFEIKRSLYLHSPILIETRR